MKLTLYRKWWTDKSTIGEMHINGSFFCFTLEDRLRTGTKVPGSTAIPAGKYSVAITHSNRFGRLMPLLVNVPGFEGIRIHAGNTDKDTSGCILVGRRRGKDSIGESRSAYNELYASLAKAISTEKIEIEIVNPPDWADGVAAHSSGQANTAQTRSPGQSVAAQPPQTTIIPIAASVKSPQVPAPAATATSTVHVAVRWLARLLPVSSPLLAGSATWFVQYKWPLLCAAAAIIGFWLGWLLQPPERKLQ